MKAGIFFTGSGPLVILTSYESFEDKYFIQKLTAKGIAKFIAYEVSVDDVKKKYGKHYDVIMGDLRQNDDLRVLDYDGQRVFRSFDMKKLGRPIYYEE